MADLDDIPVPASHQEWRNSRAYEYVGQLENISIKLRDIVNDGARLRSLSAEELEFVAERILKIAQKAKADGEKA